MGGIHLQALPSGLRALWLPPWKGGGAGLGGWGGLPGREWD